MERLPEEPRTARCLRTGTPDPEPAEDFEPDPDPDAEADEIRLLEVKQHEHGKPEINP
jgi:hypothetical protein